MRRGGIAGRGPADRFRLPDDLRQEFDKRSAPGRILAQHCGGRIRKSFPGLVIDRRNQVANPMELAGTVGGMHSPARHRQRMTDERRFDRFVARAAIDLPRQSVGIGAKSCVRQAGNQTNSGGNPGRSCRERGSRPLSARSRTHPSHVGDDIGL